MNSSKKSVGLIRSMIISMAVTIAITLSLLSVIGFAASYSKVKSGVQNSAEQAISVYSEKINAWISEQAAFCSSQANAAGNLVAASGNRKNNDAFLDSAMTLNSSLLDCYTAYEDTALYMAVTDTSTLPEGFDPTTRGWYKDAVSANSPIFTSPYIDTATGAMVITVASPIYENGRLAGVFGCDITLDYIMELAGGMKLTANGYPVLIDGEGNILLHQSPDISPRVEGGNAVTTSVEEAGGDYSKALSETAEGVYLNKNKDFDGKTRYFIFNKLSAAGWTLGYICPVNDIDGALNGLAVIYVVLTIVFLAAGVAFVTQVIKARLKPLKKINEVAADIAAGDLSASFDYSSDDDIGILCANFARCTDTTRRYISDISQKLDRLAKGDFTVNVTEEYIGDYAPIKDAMMNIIRSMRNTLNNIEIASGQVDHGAANVAASSTRLAEGVYSQTENLKKLNDDMSVIIEKVNESDKNAREARQLAEGAMDKLQVSSSEMNKLLEAMNEISEMSAETAKIVKTIDDIAFQTNILALNASVEAARAGAAGKGFTVVADEVRNLAGKSAEAANRTSSLINRTTEAIAAGAELADSTAKALSHAVADTARVDENIGLISKATREQSEFMTSISHGINAISDVVSTTAESAQSGAASSEELSGQASMLSGLISKFRL
ncbi:MAG: methyl-accepting chemotaxis protein [Oscillospiraceae bacterium]|nr:methyl-accepting chemotaxis protein [Oscillospiraceae bacterium]